MNRNHPKFQAVFVFLAVLLGNLPMLGSYGLFDPWETHYAEVARTMIQRDDPVSTYWQDDGFYSKPPLLFWMQAAGFTVAGLNRRAAPADEMTVDSRPEWAARLPVLLLAAFAVTGVFLFLRRHFDPLTGLFAALTVAFLPHFALVARQSITDMPFLALMTLGMLMFFHGFLGDDGPPVRLAVLKLGRRALPVTSGLVSAVVFVLLVVPQYFMFASRVPASFTYGGRPVIVSGWLVFLPYLVLLADVLIGIARSRFTQGQLWILHGFAMCGLAILAKGFGALFIPGVVFLLYFLLTGEWDRLRRFPLVSSLWMLVAIAFPWHHAMIIRHGDAFFQEYIVHHHFKRAAEGVHGERGTFAYYWNQLLFGLFPLWPLLPAAFASGLRKVRFVRPGDDRERLHLLLFLWLMVSFFLFSLMLTKFHHYILPVTVPAGVWVAVSLRQYWSGGPSRGLRFSAAFFAGLVFFVLVAREAGLDPAHFVNLFIYKYERLFPYAAWMNWTIWGLSAVIGCAALVLVFRRNRWTFAAFLLASTLFTIHLLAFYMPAVGPHWSQKQLHKIYYQCRRDAGERLIAWQLNWRGENFYSKNQVVPLMETNNKEFLEYLRRFRARRREDVSARFIVLEAGRFNRLVGVMDRELYIQYPEIYENRRGAELVTILGPDCVTVPAEFEKHPVQTNYQVLKAPYVHNKFILVRLTL
ncbi:MAG: hypothetical protein CVU65_14770 [Deltaproteobacteria bacterium HGW-Deltaproteobacteria-22]|nr:MAG: hypothetical protein CVU65_14770 [Deltaproteobacteria bacterium HGW-Deltaproteobacteria-22]